MNTILNNIKKPILRDIRPASQSQINRLYYEALSAALALAPLGNFPMWIDGKIVIGESIRPYLSTWYQQHNIPIKLRAYYVRNWVIPESIKFFKSAGIQPPRHYKDFFGNLSRLQAEFLIKKFSELKLNSPEFIEFREKCTRGDNPPSRSILNYLFNFIKGKK